MSKASRLQLTCQEDLYRYLALLRQLQLRQVQSVLPLTSTSETSAPGTTQRMDGAYHSRLHAASVECPEVLGLHYP